MDETIRKEILRVLDAVACEVIIAEDCKDFAHQYSLLMLEAHKEVTDIHLQFDIMQEVLEVAEFAGISSKEIFRLW